MIGDLTLTPKLIGLGIAGAVTLSTAAYAAGEIRGRGIGAGNERVKHEKALAEAQEEWREEYGALEEKAARLTEAASAQAGKTETIIRERVVEKPVRIDTDCRIDYSVVGLLNSVARGGE